MRIFNKKTVSKTATGRLYEKYKVIVEYYKRNSANLLGNLGIYSTVLVKKKEQNLSSLSLRKKDENLKLIKTGLK